MQTIYIPVFDNQWIEVTEDFQKILSISFTTLNNMEKKVKIRNPIMIELERQLFEYFSGKRREFSIPVSPVGTPFQQQVWKKLQEIPYGETQTYYQVACQLGRPAAIRAVSTAIAKNPILFLIPCHRVIGSDGKLHGYSGGLKNKEKLLKIEKDVILKCKRKYILNKKENIK